jgi:lysine 2,3-aminomutase
MNTITAPIEDRRVTTPKTNILDKLAGWENLEIKSLKPLAPENAFEHKQLLEGEFWRHIPSYKNIDTETFLDHSWQSRNAVTKPKHLLDVLGNLIPEFFYQDVQRGIQQAPMSMRVTPYIMALIDWEAPYSCPVATQFIPVGRHLLEDHSKLTLDSLHEQADEPVAGVTHRYYDKALFLPLSICPVYCRFCTRSYSIGPTTESVDKISFGGNYNRWREAFAYIASRPELEDIVISGGDAYHLRPEQIEAIGITLLNMPNIRRIRIATKALAILPQFILSHKKWLDAVTTVAEYARKKHKEVAIHTHFNHPSEATWITREAMGLLYERGIIVRNQTVLQKGVNDDEETMTTLVRRLGYLNIHPYYVYLCDMVKGVEDLRTSTATAVRLEKIVRGSTAGFNTPTFVCDAPGGGGKRTVSSYEYYNRDTGIAVYTAPSVKQDKFFMYFDPLHSLNEEYRERWKNSADQKRMIQDALEAAKKRF